MMKFYSMTLVWSTYCKFIFPTWATRNTTIFIIGCVVTMLLCFLSMALPKIKKRLEKMLFTPERFSTISDGVNSSQSSDQENLRLSSTQKLMKNVVIPIIYYLIYSTLHVAIMLIMMSMNGYVIIAIILGYTFGYLAFNDICKNKLQNKCHAGCSEMK